MIIRIGFIIYLPFYLSFHSNFRCHQDSCFILCRFHLKTPFFDRGLIFTIFQYRFGENVKTGLFVYSGFIMFQEINRLQHTEIITYNCSHITKRSLVYRPTIILYFSTKLFVNI